MNRDLSHKFGKISRRLFTSPSHTKHLLQLLHHCSGRIGMTEWQALAMHCTRRNGSTIKYDLAAIGMDHSTLTQDI